MLWAINPAAIPAAIIPVPITAIFLVIFELIWLSYLFLKGK
jgi:hypothetical protein